MYELQSVMSEKYVIRVKWGKFLEILKQIVLGALFHDIGHLVGLDRGLDRMVTDGFDLGTTGHERVGEEFLMQFGMPQEVVAFVRGHVDAKRYLVLKDKLYYDGLSKASKQTLEHQGGAMSEDEAKKFENSEKFAAIIRMRQWDELAKDPDTPIESIEKYKEMCRKYLERKCIAHT
ncbi:2-amino-1-hydroxyethylphosphonate dioxygenase (glycine-forming)-like [Anneissia japonica]|uniref:2-amino-1-hydroxyethylphosphonate dioxygenase (glycine-forming)-like n=1 Tax=Anneissia japonica TaxID=1529436 RepID=UPI001425B619|nr:2-amino-1-hydroxyethylphosphonate dioxygenase (glycine-forming)-like [Anneissia japonica]